MRTISEILLINNNYRLGLTLNVKKIITMFIKNIILLLLKFKIYLITFVFDFEHSSLLYIF